MPLTSPLFLAFLSGLLTSVAWWIPGSVASALLGWLSALCLVAFVRSPRASYAGALILGCTIYCLGFYWLLFTIKDFGGYSYFGAALVFLLFVVLSANQQLIFVFVRRHLPRALDSLGLLTACAWITSEFISIRIFPWSFGHPQIAFPLFAQSADLFGAPTIAFLQLWLVEALWISLRSRKVDLARAVPVVLFLGALAYGWARISHYGSITPARVPVALVQANISVKEKHNIKYFGRNRERYEALSAAVAKPGTLVIWPESVITDAIPDYVRHRRDNGLLPSAGPGVSMLVGAITFLSPDEIFNSAIALLPDGTVHPPYHKRILMPFGEYMPFAKTFPWLRDMNPTAGEFVAGHRTSVFPIVFPSESGPITAGVAPLICYEDIAPDMARDAVLQGAQILVNMTNDAWFGKTVAPYQHHLIAAFRAIENRRYLLRSTNSGLTAIVNPLGQTVAQIPGFSDGTIEYSVGVYDERTLYTRLWGNGIWWGFALVCVSVSLIRALKVSISRRVRKV